MTNEEFLKSLGTEKLAELLNDNGAGFVFAKAINKERGINPTVDWLKAECFFEPREKKSH